MTKTITCATDLIDHPEFQSLCRHWQDDLRCPLVFPDWLREQGLWKQAEVAEWAVAEPDRPIFTNRSQSGGPTPQRGGKGWVWFGRSARHEADDLYANRMTGPLGNYWYSLTF